MSLTKYALVIGAVACVASAVPAQTPAEAGLKAELVVCTSIVDREPQGADTTFAVSAGSLYAWSRITGAQGETTVKHVWSRDGQVMAEVALPVGSASWRTYSQKNLYGLAGRWEVKVVDAADSTLSTVSFTVTP